MNHFPCVIRRSPSFYHNFPDLFLNPLLRHLSLAFCPLLGPSRLRRYKDLIRAARVKEDQKETATVAAKAAVKAATAKAKKLDDDLQDAETELKVRVMK